MLHGGLGGIAEFGQLPALLAQSRGVITVELQGHGHTADIERPLRYEWMADDIAALIPQLGLGQADIFGFSLGGTVALRTCIRHPNCIRRLILVSTPVARAAIYPQFRDGMANLNAQTASFMLETPMYNLYQQTAPDVSAWPTLVQKVGELLREEYDWSSDVAGLRMPILVLSGEDDMFPASHAVDVFGGLSNAQVVILPQTDHFGVLYHSDLPNTLSTFLASAV